MPEHRREMFFQKSHRCLGATVWQESMSLRASPTTRVGDLDAQKEAELARLGRCCNDRRHLLLSQQRAISEAPDRLCRRAGLSGSPPPHSWPGNFDESG